MTIALRLKFVGLALVAFALSTSGLGRAASPQLTAIIPPGVERGREHVLTFTGARLKDVEEVLLYEGGVTVKQVEAADAQNVRVTIDVASDCKLGPHMAQLRTKTGISDYRSFSVGVLPSVNEKEPNNALDKAQTVELNVCVAGALQTEDADYYRVHAKKGERLSIEIEAIRLGQAYFDPSLTLYDQNQVELAAVDDTILGKQDSMASLLIPEDGDYTISVRETSYRGADNCRYRLHIGSCSLPLVAYPAGGKRGEQLKVQLLGDGSGPIEQQITVPADPEFEPFIALRDDRSLTPTAVPFRAFSEGNILETEPNDRLLDTLTAAELPLALNGRIDQPGDVDFFRLTAKKGQVWDVECYARRIGSPADTVISIHRPNSDQVLRDDDARNPDSYLRWQVPEDGDYRFRVADRFGKGGPLNVYRVEFTPVAPSLKIGIPRVDRYSQTRQTIVVPRGNRYGAVILATRSDCAGPIELLPQNLIPGVKMTARPMHASMNLMPVVFEAAEDAPLDGDLIDLRAKLADPKLPPLEGGFENSADLVLGEPNNNVYVRGVVQKLAMAVTEKVPYHLEIVPPKAPLVRFGTMNLKIVVHRDAGFDGRLTLQFPFVPPGVGATGEVTIEKGKSEGVYPLNANASAAIGKWPMMVIGAADIGGQAWVSSQLAELEVADRFVAFDMKRAACPKEQSTQIRCTLDINTPFEGNAKAELLGLPPGTSAEPLEFNEETKELVFDLRTTKGTPVGNHKSLFCQTTIMQNGEPIVANAGTTELRVTAPPAGIEVAASNNGKAGASPAKKPMSRLEQLRARILNAEEKP
jgi:hypothetical protein